MIVKHEIYILVQKTKLLTALLFSLLKLQLMVSQPLLWLSLHYPQIPTKYWPLFIYEGLISHLSSITETICAVICCCQLDSSSLCLVTQEMARWKGNNRWKHTNTALLYTYAYFQIQAEPNTHTQTHGI